MPSSLTDARRRRRNRIHHPRVVAALVLAVVLVGVSPVAAMDGFVVSLHSEAAAPKPIHHPAFGGLRRFEIKDDKVVGWRDIYVAGDASMPAVEPNGARLAFINDKGVLVVLDSDGGGRRELTKLQYWRDPGDEPSAVPLVNWPLGSDGNWLYYADRPEELRRANVDTGASELVIRFNRGICPALSQIADSNFGIVAGRPEESMLVIYDLASGTGDLYNGVATYRERGACGQSVAPDGTLIAVNDGSHRLCRLIDVQGRKVHQFELNQFAGSGSDGARIWQFMRWSNNHQWILVSQGGGGSNHEVDWLNAVLVNWQDGRQIMVCRNSAGQFDFGSVCYDRDSPLQLPLGVYTGEAPVQVEFPPGKVDDGQPWDYGDGTSGGELRHLYGAPGRYEVRVGGSVVARVVVQPQRSPSSRVSMLDASHAYLYFDEPVRLQAGAEARGVDGVIGALTLLDNGWRALLSLPKPLTRAETITVRGITDKAWQPNPLQSQELLLRPRTWPVSGQDLVFAWNSAITDNAIYDSASNEVRPCQTQAFKNARRDRNGELVFRRGTVEPLAIGWDPDEALLQAFRRHREFTLEVYMRAATSGQEVLTARRSRHYQPPAIVNWSVESGSAFSLQQHGSQLLYLHRTDRWQGRTPLGNANSAAWDHLVVSLRGGELVCYRNGEAVVRRTDIPGTPVISPGHLRFGDHHWCGRIRAVACYARFVDAAEAAANYQALAESLAQEPEVPETIVKAVLVMSTRVPAAADILPYRQALTVNEWRVESVLSGELNAERVRVAQWGIVNGYRVDPVFYLPGHPRLLRLQPWPEELATEMLIDTLEDNFDLDLYLDGD